MMGSLYIGATGLVAHGEGMQAVTNNLANANTIGFKQTMTLYQDLMSQSVMSRSNSITNMSQSGMGARVGEMRRIFTEGGFEPGSATTDVAIQGKGFFGVTKNGVVHYTRAGNFRFDEKGALRSPEGWNVLGRKIVNGVPEATPTPIDVDFSTGEGGFGYMAGKATTKLTAISQLGGMKDIAKDPTNPYFAVASKWDGTKTPAIGSGEYSYAEPIELYDATGTKRNATVFYDFAGEQNGQKVMEYVIAMDPSEDGSARAGTSSAGLLMAGTVSFSSTGHMVGMTAFTPPAGNQQDLAQWSAAPMVGGVPTFTANFKGAGAQQVSFDMGITLPAGSGYATAAELNTNPDSLYRSTNGIERGTRTSTYYGNSPSSVVQINDGFSEGFLRDMHISQNGTIVGHYSNNQSADLYQMSLFRFTSQDGLRAEGGNRFSASLEAGEVQEGLPGTENFGSIQERYLEQSNVDFAREFTSMIITQRGYQMNTKVITTSDMMLQRALELKK